MAQSAVACSKCFLFDKRCQKKTIEYRVTPARHSIWHWHSIWHIFWHVFLHYSISGKVAFFLEFYLTYILKFHMASYLIYIKWYQMTFWQSAGISSDLRSFRRAKSRSLKSWDPKHSGSFLENEIMCSAKFGRNRKHKQKTQSNEISKMKTLIPSACLETFTYSPIGGYLKSMAGHWLWFETWDAKEKKTCEMRSLVQKPWSMVSTCPSHHKVLSKPVAAPIPRGEVRPRCASHAHVGSMGCVTEEPV